jgi:hypothetical protein
LLQNRTVSACSAERNLAESSGSAGNTPPLLSIIGAEFPKRRCSKESTFGRK